MGLLLLCIAAGFTATVLLKHYVPRFAAWRFGALLALSSFCAFIAIFLCLLAAGSMR